MTGGGDRLRRMVRKLHLWLGLVIGGLFVLLGLTGSVLVFYPEIDALLHPEIRLEALAGPAREPDWGRALATVRQAWPDKPGKWRFEVTGTPGAFLARQMFRHKTRKQPFSLQLWGVAVVQVGLAIGFLVPL